MMNNPKYTVSVIIPIYTEGKDLKTSIKSIINQSMGFENIELIIVDNASDDKTTHKIISNYQSQYPENIKAIFLDKNSGFPGKPRNEGMKHVNSDYIIFSDDDTYKKDALEILYKGIIKYKSDMSMGKYVYNNRKFKQIKESPMIF